MKIIKPGIIKKPFYKCTCLKCGCVFECEPNEGVDISDKDQKIVQFTCPTCNNSVFAYGSPKIISVTVNKPPKNP